MATLPDPSPYLNFLISPRIPPELVLKTIQHLPFNDGTLITAIRSAHPRLRAIFKNYEKSITGSFMRKELRHAETDFSRQDGRLNVDWLADCVSKYDIVDDVMDALCSEHNFNAVLRHNISLANAGLLLLYKLVSIGQSHMFHSTNLVLRKTNSQLTRGHLVSIPHRSTHIHQESAPGSAHSNLPHPPPRHPFRPLPRLRLDKPTHLRPLHGRQPSLAALRVGILFCRSCLSSRSRVHLGQLTAPRYG